MKIDFVISSLIGGGAQRVLILLANALVQKGYHINIVTFNAPDIFVADKRVGRVRLHEDRWHRREMFCNGQNQEHRPCR